MKVRTIHVIVGEPDCDAVENCGDCGFDAVVRLPLTALSDDGVSDWGAMRVCGRCYYEQQADEA